MIYCNGFMPIFAKGPKNAASFMGLRIKNFMVQSMAYLRDGISILSIERMRIRRVALYASPDKKATTLKTTSDDKPWKNRAGLAESPMAMRYLCKMSTAPALKHTSHSSGLDEVSTYNSCPGYWFSTRIRPDQRYSLDRPGRPVGRFENQYLARHLLLLQQIPLSMQAEGYECGRHPVGVERDRLGAMMPV